MSFEYKPNFSKEKEKPKRKNAPKKTEEPAMTRRGFLKLAGGLLGAAAAGKGLEAILREDGEIGRPEEESGEVYGAEAGDKASISTQEMSDSELDREEMQYNQKIKEEKIKEIESLADILDFDEEGEIRLTPEVMEKVKNYWKNRYLGADPRLYKSLLDGYSEWGSWRKYTENEFASVGVPIRYALLAIPESHWKVNALSEMGAAGPYQFMRSTALSVNLKIGHVIDERRDPLKSARACAKVLKELYEAAHDWNVALSGYNGSFAWRFIKEAKAIGQATNYQNFLKHIERKLNEIMAELNTSKKYSKLSHDEKRKIFAKKISGFAENLNYPQKLWGIEEAIEQLKAEGKIGKQKPSLNFGEKIIQVEAPPEQSMHTVVKGETLFGIARKANIPPQQLYKHNRGVRNIKNLRPGDKIKIPKAKRKGYSPNSLLAEAKKRGKSEREMRFLNPHVLDAQAPLPKGTVIRV